MFLFYFCFLKHHPSQRREHSRRTVPTQSNDELLDSLKITRNKGNLLVYAVYAKPVDGFDFQDQHRREITIYGSSGSPDSYPEAIRLVGSGKINVQAFVSHRLRLEELPHFFADGIIQQQSDGYLKAVVLL